MKSFVLLFILVLLSSIQMAAQQDSGSFTFSASVLRNESLVLNLSVPQPYGSNGAEWRGFGQIFAPRIVHNWFDTIYNEGSNILFNPDAPNNPEGVTDQDYIDQFAGNIIGHKIDSVEFYVWNNPRNSSPEHDGTFAVYRTDVDFSTAGYRATLFSESIDSLDVMDKHTLQKSSLMESIDTAAGLVYSTKLLYSPPLSFNENESAVFLYYNDSAPVASAAPDAEYQSVRGYEEYGLPNAENLTASRSDSISRHKAMSVVLLRTPTGQSRIISTQLTLQIQPRNQNDVARRALVNMDLQLWGTLLLSSASDVRYHFGQDASRQGLGQVTPNPVHEGARLPFALTEYAEVTVAVYDMEGRKVCSLLEGERYIPGSYSLELPMEHLTNGVYLVRMSADGTFYSMKFTVAR